jgi:hypothetical protein
MADHQVSECMTTPEALTMPDIVLHIMFSIDDVSELAQLASVCKIWNDVYSDDRLWNQLVELHYGHAIASQISAKTCMRREYCKLVCLHSNKLTGWCEDKFTSNGSCYRMLLHRELMELHADPDVMVTRGEIRWVSCDSAGHNTPSHRHHAGELVYLSPSASGYSCTWCLRCEEKQRLTAAVLQMELHRQPHCDARECGPKYPSQHPSTDKHQEAWQEPVSISDIMPQQQQSIVPV